MGPKEPRSTVLTAEEEAMIVAFRRHTLLPLDDCLYALQPTIPHLTRSSLHRCLERHGISRLPEIGVTSRKRRSALPIGYFHIDIAEVRTEEGKLTCSWRSTEPRSSPSPAAEEPTTRSRRLPARPDRGCALRHPHGPDRQRPQFCDAPRIDLARQPATVGTCSTASATSTASSIA